MVRIKRAIVHEIPKGRYSAESTSEIRLSAAETQLAAETQRFIEDNMIQVGLKSSRKIVEDPKTNSTTPGFVRQILNTEECFVAASQELAHNLYRAQTGNSPSGILIVASVEHGGGHSVVILKAEHAEGMRLRESQSGDSNRFDLEHLNELIVGNNSRIYKIALLQNREDNISGEMLDKQNGVAYADFFLSTFLGCQLADDAETKTKQFVDAALNWVNSINEPALESQYATALFAYLHSQKTTFQAPEFAADFLRPEHQDDFIDALPPEVAETVINKDFSLLPGKARGLSIHGPGLLLRASADAFQRGVIAIISEESDATTVRIQGSVKQFGLGSAPKE